MSGRGGTSFGMLFVLSILAAAAIPRAAEASARRVAIAWREANGDSAVRGMSVESPWAFVTPALPVATGSRLRFASGKLFALSETAGTVQVIDPQSWSMERTIALGSLSQPIDIAAVNSNRAYVTRAGATRLLRLNPTTGATTESTDFAPLADLDGIPDLGTMIVDGDRLLVQVRRLNVEIPEFFLRPAYIAVVDLATEALVDVDPVNPGIQGIALQGTAPVFKMQIGPVPRRLFVSASWNTHNQDAGIEMIDLDTLQSLGVVAAESDPPSGVCCDMAPFTMVSASKGFFTFSTDSTLSSHLHYFTVGGAIDPADLYTSTGYEAANLVHDPGTNHLFLPTLEVATAGVHVFDAANGARLTAAMLPTLGLITDLVLLCNCGDPACADVAECVSIPATSTWGVAILGITLLVVGTVVLRGFRARGIEPRRTT